MFEFVIAVMLETRTHECECDLHAYGCGCRSTPRKFIVYNEHQPTMVFWLCECVSPTPHANMRKAHIHAQTQIHNNVVGLIL